MYDILVSMADEMIVKGLQALADPQRLQIVEFLSQCCYGVASIHDDGRVEGPTAGEICCHVTGDPKLNIAIRRQLQELESAGLIRITQRGETMLCSLRSDGILAVSNFVAQISRGDIEKEYCCTETNP